MACLTSLNLGVHVRTERASVLHAWELEHKRSPCPNLGAETSQTKVRRALSSTARTGFHGKEEPGVLSRPYDISPGPSWEKKAGLLAGVTLEEIGGI
jgi:hypothetical protein